MIKRRRKNIPKQLQIKIWRRDGWMCRYCGEPMIFAPTLQALEALNPGHGYYQPNGDHRFMLELFAKRWSSVDHVQPHARGGEHHEENFVSACWQCNVRKGSRLKTPLPISIPILNWDGLSGLYIKLIQKPDVWTRLLVNPS